MRQKHVLVRDVVTGRGDEGGDTVRSTESIEVEIDWPDPTGLMLASPGIGGTHVGDWRVLNPAPMGAFQSSRWGQLVAEAEKREQISPFPSPDL